LRRETQAQQPVHAEAAQGLDRLLCLRFGDYLAGLEPEEFIRLILVEGLGVKYLVVGDDFHFGKDRAGNFQMLVRAGDAHGFQVVNMHTFNIDHARVSSTRIREALDAGNFDMAESLLGRPFRMSGRVAHGDKRGRTIGFPTANIHLHRSATPLQGVFAVELFGIKGEPHQGVANIGTRPTVGGTRTLLEVHLFDFDADIYGSHVQVTFLHKLRDEQRFDSFEELKQQINADVKQAREFFRS
ncbi:MAG: bifunctional riboflavin kinase/FAD synthetase, partial [Gammaproteobacteria bacterium]|nr:bifunctional riboflavin kinase/FAD synthetase [Gammaproteobacteria bacterium]